MRPLRARTTGNTIQWSSEVAYTAWRDRILDAAIVGTSANGATVIMVFKKPSSPVN